MRIVDGLVGATVLAAGLGLAARLQGLDRIAYSGWLFLAGIGLVVVFGIWGFLGGESPPGVLVLMGRRPADPPRGAALPAGLETEPAEARLGREIWIDRIITTRNVWVTSGFLLLAGSFLMLFLGT